MPSHQNTFFSVGLVLVLQKCTALGVGTITLITHEDILGVHLVTLHLLLGQSENDTTLESTVRLFLATLAMFLYVSLQFMNSCETRIACITGNILPFVLLISTSILVEPCEILARSSHQKP